MAYPKTAFQIIGQGLFCGFCLFFLFGVNAGGWSFSFAKSGQVCNANLQNDTQKQLLTREFCEAKSRPLLSKAQKCESL